MAKLSPAQVAWRNRIEAGLRFAQPFLDLLLVAGERISRAADREQLDTARPRTSLAPGQEEPRNGR